MTAVSDDFSPLFFLCALNSIFFSSSLRYSTSSAIEKQKIRLLRSICVRKGKPQRRTLLSRCHRFFCDFFVTLRDISWGEKKRVELSFPWTARLACTRRWTHTLDDRAKVFEHQTGRFLESEGWRKTHARDSEPWPRRGAHPSGLVAARFRTPSPPQPAVFPRC